MPVAQRARADLRHGRAEVGREVVSGPAVVRVVKVVLVHTVASTAMLTVKLRLVELMQKLKVLLVRVHSLVPKLTATALLVLERSVVLASMQAHLLNMAT